MKKTLFKGLALLGLLVSMVLTSCKNDAPAFLYDVEPDASVITAKAYPGFNYVTWTYVDENTTIFVFRDDGVGITPTSGDYYVVDTDIQDGVTYTYTAYTVFDTDPINFQYEGTDVSTNPNDTTAWALSSVSTSTTCKAINPSYIKDGNMMTAIELCNYEVNGDSKYVITENNIVMNINEGKFQVAWPTKNYLNYEAYIVPAANIELFGLDQAIVNSGVKFESTYNYGTQYDNNAKLFYTNNGTYKVRRPIMNAGKYKVAVKVSAVNDSMYDTVTILSANEFVVEALDVVDHTNVIAADYIDEGTTIRVIWTPATKKDASSWGTENYTVYTKDSDKVYTPIANIKTAKVNENGEQVKDENGNVIYDFANAPKADLKKNEPVLYCDYAVTNNKIDYRFEVVLSENGKYEEAPASTDSYVITKSVGKYAELPELAVSYDTTDNKYTVTNGDSSSLETYAKFDIAILDLANPITDVYNDVNLYFDECAKDFTIKSVKYKVVSKWANESSLVDDLILDSEMTSAAVIPSADYTMYDIFVKDVAEKNKVVFLIQMGYKGYKDAYYVVESDFIDLSISINSGEFSYNQDTSTTNIEASKYDVEISAGDFVNYSNYTYQVFKTKLDKDGYVDETCKWEEVQITISKNTYGYYVGETKVTFDPTTPEEWDGDGAPIEWKDNFAFKFVKTNKHSGAFDVDYSDPIAVTKDKN